MKTLRHSNFVISQTRFKNHEKMDVGVNRKIKIAQKDNFGFKIRENVFMSLSSNWVKYRKPNNLKQLTVIKFWLKM